VPASQTPAPAGPQKDDRVREQLERVLASATFRQVDRLKRFLSFVVTEAIAGRGDQLKEYVIGVQVFDKESSFDPRADPIVRVQARRLRTRLMRYYREEARPGELVLELPKGGYAPTFRPHEPSSATKRSIAAALVQQNTIAVLPFADYSAAGDLGCFCQAVRQDVISALAALDGLRVLAWDPHEANHANDPRQAVTMLHAALVVTGSVRSCGDKLRVTTQIIDGASGSYLWSEPLDFPAPDFAARYSRSRRAVSRERARRSWAT
jgi:serine/threonine-protein kinase